MLRIKIKNIKQKFAAGAYSIEFPWSLNFTCSKLNVIHIQANLNATQLSKNKQRAMPFFIDILKALCSIYDTRLRDTRSVWVDQ
jgi:hypothetical protein